MTNYAGGVVEPGCQMMRVVALSTTPLFAYRTARNELRAQGKDTRRLYVVKIEHWEYCRCRSQFLRNQPYYMCLFTDHATDQELMEKYPVDNTILHEVFQENLMGVTP